MAGKIVLAGGQAMTRPIESTDITPVVVKRFIDQAGLIEWLRDYAADWHQAAHDSGADICDLAVNMELIFDDIARALQIPPGDGPDEWPFLED